jgi:hypothetical protein
MNWERWGGRKNVNGYLYAVLTTGMALKLGATFPEYATWLAIALLGTSAMVAYEDLRRPKP